MAGRFIQQYAFFFDASACTGCKACQLACKDKNDLGPGLLWRRVYEVSGGAWRREGEAWTPDIAAYNVSLACNHCLNPSCVDSCPTGAVWKRADGLVFIDGEKCIGCRYCEWACPYGAVRFDAAAHRATKCDFCSDLVGAGEKPACVAACPARALDCGDFEELKKIYGEENAIFPLPDPSLTEPALILKPHRDASGAEDKNAAVANWEEL
ncbi:MAG: dimethylsulfoxide reductase subunit B [Candidatus Aminicenantes bacterium]|nr:dimethylsulfoxide reductase subunit B [Candidatus Aminicenantes bacterium]